MLKKRFLQNGAIFFETVIALIILSVIIVGLARSFRNLSVASGAVRAQTVALNLARQRIEFIKQYESSPSASASTIADNITSLTSMPSSQTINGIPYTITTSKFSSTEKNADINKYTAITPLHIKVEWAEGGINKSITLEYYYQ